jgi:hypothetical protein
VHNFNGFVVEKLDSISSVHLQDARTDRLDFATPWLNGSVISYYALHARGRLPQLAFV